MMWPHMGYYGDGWWTIMMIGMIIFWVVVVVGLYLLYRVLVQQGTLRPAVGHAPNETPRAILDRRLAAGDITPAEYSALRRRLGGRP